VAGGALNHTAQLLNPIKKPMTDVVLPSGAQPLKLAMFQGETMLMYLTAMVS